MAATLPSLTLLHGDDEFAIAERVDALKQKLGGLETSSLNTTEVQGRDMTLAILRSICDTMPFLAERRMVIVYNGIGGAKGTRDGNARRRDWISKLIDYLPDLPSFCSLVLVENHMVSGRSKGKKSLILEAIKKVEGSDVRCYSVPTGNDLVRWIIQRAVDCGGEFSRNAARSLAMAYPGRARMIQSEIEKLLTYVNYDRPVSTDDVRLLTDMTGHQANIFKLVDAVGQGNGRKATAELRCLLEQREYEPMQVFGMIVRQYRLLLQTKEVLDTGGDVGNVKECLKLHPFVAEKMVIQARRYDLQSLENIYCRLLKLDVAMKNGADHMARLDLLVGDLAA